MTDDSRPTSDDGRSVTWTLGLDQLTNPLSTLAQRLGVGFATVGLVLARLRWATVVSHRVSRRRIQPRGALLPDRRRQTLGNRL